MLLGTSTHRAGPSRAPDVVGPIDDGGRSAPSVAPSMRSPHAVSALFRRVEQRLANPPRVLVYHQISEPPATSSDFSVSREHFDEQVSVLARKANVIRLEEVSKRRGMVGSPRARPSFSITFDDGYSDGLRVALPVLERYDVPATVFVASDFIDRPFFWWDRVAEIVSEPTIDVDAIVDAGEHEGLLDLRTTEPRISSRSEIDRELTRALARLENPERHRLLTSFQRTVNFIEKTDSPRPLTATELDELAAHPLITIGNHTHTHPRLTSLSPAQARFEIVACNDRLDELIGSSSTPRPFAYPNGDANREVAAIAGRAGCKQGFNTVSRPISRTDNPLLLPRIATSNVDGDEFARLRRLS